MGTVTPLFRLIFITVLVLTVAFAAAHFVLVMTMPEPSAQAVALMGAASDAWQGGLGAIFGLMGGKAASS
jgi:hypothetical protein